MNLKIKYRESFRPFAPAVLNEEKTHWFDLDDSHENPYMLMVAPVRAEHRKNLSESEMDILNSDPDLLRRVNISRSSIPAVTHVDYSARVQTVGEEGQPRFRSLLRAFKDRTGCPILINTSFNVRGEPIVCTPDDALRCFAATDMDALVLGRCVVKASGKAALLGSLDKKSYIENFELD